MKNKLSALFILCLLQTVVQAHEIHLNNDRVIKTASVQEQNGKVIYTQYGGKITISKDDVKKIVYDHPQATGADEQIGKKITQQGVTSPETLDQSISGIEKAALATVLVESASGHGSGFFVSSDGYIITNRHVVRGSKQSEKKMDRQIELGGQVFSDLSKRIVELKQIIKRNQKTLKDNIRTYRMNQRALRYSRNKSILYSQKSRIKADKAALESQEVLLSSTINTYNEKKSQFNEWKYQAGDIRRKQSWQSEFKVILSDNTFGYAELVHISEDYDIALLKIRGHRLSFLSTSEQRLPVGEPVFAIGSPAQEHNIVTSGIVSGFKNGFIQTNAQISKGNSGGPLITKNGQVIGINTAIIATGQYRGLGLAIPVDVAKQEFSRYFDWN